MSNRFNVHISVRCGHSSTISDVVFCIENTTSRNSLKKKNPVVYEEEEEEEEADEGI